MIEFHADIVIVGSSFGGSLLAMIASRLGLRTVLVDRATHPRFAIQEFATPIASLILRDLAKRYDLPEIEPLCDYDSAKEAYPDLVTGINRGFAFYRHSLDQAFSPCQNHSNELLVAAGTADGRTNSHWLRSGIDQFFFKQARIASLATMEHTDITDCSPNGKWVVSGLHSEEPVRILADFVVDASGENGVVLRSLKIGTRAERLRTNTRAIYAHFNGVQNWQDIYQRAGGQVSDHPFCCDESAMHQMIDGGWMWQLPFRNGTTSCGLVLNQNHHPSHPDWDAEERWHDLVQKYPSLAEQLHGSKRAEATPDLISTGRLQRLADQAAGHGWAALPNTVGFVDPLHSTGIAHTLVGVERLATILEQCWGTDELTHRLSAYDRQVRTEFEFLDTLVHACYLAMDDFARFSAASMLYFAAATTYENRLREGLVQPESGFLCSGDKPLQGIIDRTIERLKREAKSDPANRADASAFQSWLKEQIQPYNQVGLCDPSANNMYSCKPQAN